MELVVTVRVVQARIAVGAGTGQVLRLLLMVPGEDVRANVQLRRASPE